MKFFQVFQSIGRKVLRFRANHLIVIRRRMAPVRSSWIQDWSSSSSSVCSPSLPHSPKRLSFKYILLLTMKKVFSHSPPLMASPLILKYIFLLKRMSLSFFDAASSLNMDANWLCQFLELIFIASFSLVFSSLVAFKNFEHSQFLIWKLIVIKYDVADNQFFF